MTATDVRRFGALAVAAAGPFGAGAFAARLLAARHPAALAVDFAQPYPIVTAWGGYGAAAFALVAAAVAGAAALLAFAVPRLAAEAGPSGGWTIAGAALAAVATAAAWPFGFSSDAYAYAAYGDLANRGFDPYVLGPPGLHDALLDAARWQWSGPFPVDVYGPAMLLVSRAAAAAARAGGVGATLWLLRAAAAAAFGGSVVLAHAALRGAPERHRFAAACAYGLNPVAVWSVAEGHNDAFLMLAVAGAAALARRGLPVAGALALGFSPLLKAPGAAFALAAAAENLLLRTGRRRSIAFAALAGLAGASLLAVPPLLTAVGAVRIHGHYAPNLSVQGFAGLPVALALAAAAAARGFRLIASGTRRGHAWFGIGIVLALPNVYPWYALWLVPWAVAAGDAPSARALRLVTICALVRYLPDAVGTLPPTAAVAATLIATFPLTLALAEFEPVARLKKVLVSP